ncbi:hypothetical protein FQN60_015964 [Etheostoma spectabile]|uniref:Uncharacterized protein n=1 Tax=Etheostoma spectabile TaxID=54343 RepID=A0A5J5CMZ4_9PERO|nr:hypothetical protein FQN60_015964 [Etheostoma spectabile]
MINVGKGVSLMFSWQTLLDLFYHLPPSDHNVVYLPEDFSCCTENSTLHPEYNLSEQTPE